MREGRRPTRIWFLTLLLLLSACGREAPRETALLDRVPADTPYVFANTEPLPEGLVARLLRHYELRLQGLRRSLEATGGAAAAPVSATVGGAPGRDARVTRLMIALLDELDGHLTPEGMEALGFRPGGRTVVYGLGLLPVLRTEISDAGRLRGLVSRLEQRSGLRAPRAVYDGQDYWRFELGPALLLVAVTPDALVMALVPDGLEADYLPHLLGGERPRATLAAEGGYGRLLQEYGFTPLGAGYIDLVAVAGILTGEATRPEVRAWRSLGLDEVQPEPACGGLVRALAAAVPRYAAGATAVGERRYAMRAVLESSPALAAHLRRLPARVPGLGRDTDALFSFGVGLDLPALRGGVKALIRTLIAQGRGCSWVDEAALQASLPQVDLALGPFVAGIRGFYLEAEELELDPRTLRPRELRARLLAAVDDPRGLLALLGMLEPGLGALEVPEDGTPVAVPGDLLPPGAPPMEIAIQGRALALATGTGGAAALRRLLQAPPVTPTPILAMGYDAGRLLARLASLSDRLADELKAQGKPEDAERLRRNLASLARYGDTFGRVSMRVSPSSRGLVFDQILELR